MSQAGQDGPLNQQQDHPQQHPEQEHDDQHRDLVRDLLPSPPPSPPRRTSSFSWLTGAAAAGTSAMLGRQQQQQASPHASRQITVHDLKNKVCWICQDGEEDEVQSQQQQQQHQGGSTHPLPRRKRRFVHPCKCTLVAHEAVSAVECTMSCSIRTTSADRFATSLPAVPPRMDPPQVHALQPHRLLPAVRNALRARLAPPVASPPLPSLRPHRHPRRPPGRHRPRRRRDLWRADGLRVRRRPRLDGRRRRKAVPRRRRRR